MEDKEVVNRLFVKGQASLNTVLRFLAQVSLGGVDAFMDRMRHPTGETKLYMIQIFWFEKKCLKM